jgi:hypothetical protein
MDSHTFHTRQTASQFARIIRGLFRGILCLCMWSGPTPIMHAHEKSGSVIEENPDLAQHVRVCHNDDDCDYCQHWHMHFMLWGEVQPDSQDPDSEPQLPPQRDLQSEFAIAPISTGLSAELDRVEALGSPFDLLGLAPDFSPATRWEGILERAPLSSFQSRVAVSHDVTRLLMVVRC